MSISDGRTVTWGKPWLFAVLLFLSSLIAGTVSPVDSVAQDHDVRLGKTEPLQIEGDIASFLVEGVDRFLLKQLDEAAQSRKTRWQEIYKPETDQEELNAARERLQRILGITASAATKRPVELELVETLQHSALLISTDTLSALQVRWPTADGLYGEGILLQPKSDPVARVILVPDADQTPEQLCGLTNGLPVENQIARQLAAQGCQVLVVSLIDRGRAEIDWPYQHKINNREFLYRSAFELGRTLVGYELNKVLAGVDAFATVNVNHADSLKIAVAGYGEGGMLSLYAAAIDQRVDVALVSGYFQDRTNIWHLPIERNLFGSLNEFGDAELAAMIAPRKLIIETSHFPDYEIAPGGDCAPTKIETPPLDQVIAEFSRAQELVARRSLPADWISRVGKDGQPAFGASATAALFTAVEIVDPKPLQTEALAAALRQVDNNARQRRQILEIDALNQRLLADSGAVRQQFMSKLDTSSLEKFVESSEQYRKIFRDDVIGRFDLPLLEARPRLRPYMVHPDQKLAAGLSATVDYYEVVLDVFPDVIAYGILCLPQDLRADEKRPVVVCQHGLEGRPQDVIGKEGENYYKAFASRLAERGFITFAPQNLYIFRDRFRSLQRKANPLGKTLFSIIVPQHQQIVNWLQSLPNVDDQHIAFYGLSYGGKSAMRIPPLVSDYCLSICSADFNEWVDKNASTRNLRSYVWRNEYEIFEWNLGHTFNYAEMATLIAPRPFMVERGHFDGVGDDWTVAWEFAKVRHLYQARLNIGDRCEIEWFVGPHSINGQATYDFLHRQLDWPKPELK